MLEAHLACPKCGYDLHGIPAVRCPECGFRYDAAALRSMSAAPEWTRLAHAREVTLRATIAAGLAMPAVCDRLGVSGRDQFLIIALTYVAVFAAWVVIADAHAGLVSVPTLILLFVGFAVALVYALIIFRPLAMIASVPLLGMVWLDRITEWPVLPGHEVDRSAELRPLVKRYTALGTVMPIVATILVLFVLLT